RHINFLNEENYRDPVTEIIDDNAMNTFRRTQYSQTNYSASYSYDGRFRPLYRNEIFDQSNLQYSFGGTLVRSRRYNDGDGPELSPHWGAWAKNEDLIPGLTAHRLAANLAVNIMDKRQNATVSFTLPPLDPLISFDTVIRFWISETKADFSIKQEPDTGEWVYNPFRFTEILTFNNRSNLTYYMVFDPQTNNEITAITSTLNFYDITAGFKMLKTHQLNFAPNNPSAPYLGGKWEQYGEPVLIPAELSFGYKRLFLNKEIIKNRMGFSADVNSAVTFNFLENTKSNFQFTMGFNFGITGFMDIKLSATSANAVIWRYFKGVPGMGNLTSMYMDGPQNNVFTDLFDSFNFSNNTVRSRSGFKMKSFNLDIIHYLGDWRAEFGIAMKPNTSNTASGNRITTDINFLVQWIPISEIKTNPTYDGALDRWFRN
ncbi:MAG: hypothetical protein LBI12_04185, partial [Treponema sp.]|nr:hypothetical protein [Treponema sp.]